VYFLIELVGLLDLSGFLKAYRSDGKGGAAHRPRMMLTLLLYAYCDGERSARRIEERCRTDIAYRVATGGHMPDHTTIARFATATRRPSPTPSSPSWACACAPG
jgi:transposase